VGHGLLNCWILILSRREKGTSPKDTPQLPEKTGSYLLTLAIKPDITRYDLKFSSPEKTKDFSTGLSEAINSLWKGYTFMAADSREVMNIRQASQYLGVSPDTLYKYVTEEKIPAFKLGNRWKFKKTILDQWMEQKSTMNMSSAKKKPKAAKAASAR
jgi:excisionase family DNA binding protein